MSGVTGIDFGNLDCVIAVPKRGPFGLGIDTLQNENGSRKTPTCVAYSEKQRFIGAEGLAQQMSNASNTVVNLKRLLGRMYDDPEIAIEQKFNPLKLVNRNGRVAVEVEYEGKAEVLLPEQIVGAMLGKCKRIAEHGLDGAKVGDAVIGVPAWWTDQQRRALLDAANIAGLNVLRLVAENTLVALNYQFSRMTRMDAKERESGKEIRVMFVDVGHTSTNVSLVSFAGMKVQVLSTATDRNLGGRDFDMLLVNHFAEYIKTKYKMDVMTNTKARLKLMKECSRIKNTLSANSKVTFSVEYIMNDRDVSGVIERPEFEALAAKELLPRILDPVRRVLEQTGTKAEDLHSVEIIGGAVRIPCVQKALEDYLKRPMSKTCDGDESVARGAAWQAALLSPRYTIPAAPQLKDLYPYGISVHWGEVNKRDDGKSEDVDQLFISNTLIPNTKIMSFYRTDPFLITTQYTDVSNLPPGNPQQIAKFIVSGIPKPQPQVEPLPEGFKLDPPTVKVKLRLNESGVLAATEAELLEERVVDAPPEPAAAKPAPSPSPTNAAASPPPAGSPGPDGKPADGAAPMDTSSDDAAKAAAAASPTAAAASPTPAAPKKVKKIIREKCKIEASTNGGLESKVFQHCYEREVQMAAADLAVIETGLAKNALEAYVLESRNKLGDEWRDFATQAEVDKLNTKMNETEDWLYGDGAEAQKSDYKARLEALKAIGDPIANRRREFLERGDYVSAFKAVTARLHTLLAAKDEKYAHIEAADRKKAGDEVAAAEQWLSAAIAKQDHAPKHDNPIITLAEIRKKQHELETSVNAVMSKPKPAPKPEPKKEEPKKEEPKKEEGKAGAETPKSEAPKTEGAAKMDTSS